MLEWNEELSQLGHARIAFDKSAIGSAMSPQKLGFGELPKVSLRKMSAKSLSVHWVMV